MPFLIVEPQKIEGTMLGFAVYPYHFSFDDHIDFSQKYDRKLMIFKLKNTPNIEVDKILAEKRYLFSETHRGFVDGLLQSYIQNNPQFITDKQKYEEFFGELNDKNDDEICLTSKFQTSEYKTQNKTQSNTQSKTQSKMQNEDRNLG